MDDRSYQYPRYEASQVRQFAEAILNAAGVRDDVAALTAEGLWHTSLRGVDSHGVRLIPHYLDAITGGRLNPRPNFGFERRAATGGVFDADHSLGHAAGMLAMREAIKLAQESGVGFVSVKNSSHCGAMAYYGLEAARQDMIGLAFTHATPKVRTPNSHAVFFGTNPLCMTAPMRDEAPFCFDAAPTPFTSNRVKQYHEDGRTLPPGVAADAQGQETQDAAQAVQLLPIGDYKGFGWAMMVDILCALLSGMPAGDEVSLMYGNSLSEKRYLGQFFGAIRLDVFREPEAFKAELQAVAQRIRQQPRRDPAQPVDVPGDPEKRIEAERRQHGIPIKPLDADKLNERAQRYQMTPLTPLESSSP